MGTSQHPTSTLGDLSYQSIDSRYVERRWQDWSKRLRALYSEVRAWLGSEYAFLEHPSQSFHEELMKSTKVPPKTLTVLEITDKSGHTLGRLTPVALWVIGSNGRVDVQTPGGTFIVVDTAENFQPPKWEIVPIANRRKAEPLTKTSFRRLFAH